MRLVDNYAPDSAKVVVVANKVDLRDEQKLNMNLQVNCLECSKPKYFQMEIRKISN